MKLPEPSIIVDLEGRKHYVYYPYELVCAYSRGQKDNAVARSIVAHLAHRYRFARKLAKDAPDRANLAYSCEAWNAYESANRVLRGLPL